MKSITKLDPNMIGLISSFLPIEDSVNLGQTSKRYNIDTGLNKNKPNPIV